MGPSRKEVVSLYRSIISLHKQKLTIHQQQVGNVFARCVGRGTWPAL